MKLNTDIRQRHLEKWVELFDPLGVAKEGAESERQYVYMIASDNIRCAIESGVLVDIDDVGDVPAGDVIEWSNKITEFCIPLILPVSKNS